MAFLGRRGGAAALTSADIPDNSITAAKIVDGAVDFQNELGFLENKATTQNLSGTYSTERMYLNDSYTLTGDVTVTGHLALGSIADEDIVITQDSTERTITGSGTLEAGEVLSSKETDLTGMTGELGSVVTGSPTLNLSNTTQFPAGHTLSWISHAEPSTSLSLASLGQSGYNILAVGGTVRSATVLSGNKLWITMSGGFIRFAGTASEASAGFIYTTSGTDPGNVSHGGTVPSTVVLNGLGVSSNNATSYRGLGTVQFLYENTTNSSVTVKFRPCIKNQGVNWAWLNTDTQHQINFTIVSIQG